MGETAPNAWQERASAWPVATREWRESARRPATYRLRMASGLVGAGLLFGIVYRAHDATNVTGQRLFISLHDLILGLIVGIVPALTADCLARERREGTLGLLFLTHLTARGVVIGKSLAQALRALTLWLALLPVLTVPFLTGGVKWGDAASAVTIEFCAGLICLAAGLAAPAMAKTRTGALCLAYGLAVAMLSAILILGSMLRSFTSGPQTVGELWLDGFAVATGSSAPMAPPFVTAPSYVRFVSFYNINRGWVYNYSTAARARAWMEALGWAVAASLLSLYAAVALGAEVVQRSWRDQPLSLRQEKWLRRFCQPLFAGWFRRRGQKVREKNPVAWLQQYSVKARLSKWGLCAAFLLIESWVMTWFAGGDYGKGSWQWNYSGNVWHWIERAQQGMIGILAAMLTYAAVSSFLAEKRNGALELLLVTPISVNQIILGRAWGLCRQFLPAALVLLAGEIAVLSLEAIVSPHWARGRGRVVFVSQDSLLAIFLCVNAFFSLPVFGAYAALRLKNLVAAAALTWAGLGLVLVTFLLVGSTLDAMVGDLSFPMTCGVLFVSNTVFVALAFFLLRHSLSRRIYAF